MTVTKCFNKFSDLVVCRIKDYFFFCQFKQSDCMHVLVNDLSLIIGDVLLFKSNLNRMKVIWYLYTLKCLTCTFKNFL